MANVDEPASAQGAGPAKASRPGKGLAAAVAVVLLAIVTIPLALMGSGGGDGGELVIERQGEQLLVTVPDLPSEQPEDPRAVRLRCDDAAGDEVFSIPVGWPLDTDNGRLSPHIHVPADGERGTRATTCTLLGLSRSYEGPVRG